MSRKKRDRKVRDREIRPVLNELSLKLNLDTLVVRIIGLNVIEILSPIYRHVGVHEDRESSLNRCVQQRDRFIG